MYDAIPHHELVHRIMGDCGYSYGAAETIANVLEKYEEKSGKLLEYDPVQVKITYVYYASIKEAYKDIIGTTKEMSDDEMAKVLTDMNFVIHYPKSKDDNGVIVQMD